MSTKNSTTTRSFEPFPTKVIERKVGHVLPAGQNPAEIQQANISSVQARVEKLRAQYPESPINNPAGAGPAEQGGAAATEIPLSPAAQAFLSPVERAAPVPDMSYVPSPRVAAAEAVSVQLPSRFAFYGFKDIFVSPLRGKHLSKMARSKAEKSLRLMVEAISSTLSTSDPRYQGHSLGHMLTVPDFYFILFFQRQNSYTKTSYTHTTLCTNPEHLKQVEAGVKTEQSLRITEIIKKTTLVNTELEVLPDPSLEEELGLPLQPATMGDTVDWIEHPQFDDADWRFLGEIATYLGTAETLDQKVQRVEEMDPEQIQLVRDFEKQVSTYGVNEQLTVRCKECGASKRTRVSLDAHSFLPS